MSLLIEILHCSHGVALSTVVVAGCLIAGWHRRIARFSRVFLNDDTGDRIGRERRRVVELVNFFGWERLESRRGTRSQLPALVPGVESCLWEVRVDTLVHHFQRIKLRSEGNATVTFPPWTVLIFACKLVSRLKDFFLPRFSKEFRKTVLQEQKILRLRMGNLIDAANWKRI